MKGHRAWGLLPIAILITFIVVASDPGERGRNLAIFVPLYVGVFLFGQWVRSWRRDPATWDDRVGPTRSG